MTYEEKSHVKDDIAKILCNGGYYEISPGFWKRTPASLIANNEEALEILIKKTETESKIQFVLFWVPVALFCAGVGLYVWRHT